VWDIVGPQIHQNPLVELIKLIKLIHGFWMVLVPWYTRSLWVSCLFGIL
jgi:hypothetical protein